MNLDRVTITGADDSIAPQALADISGDHPYVEWGILISRSNEGTPRYPSDRWLLSLVDLCGRSASMNLSLHVCGRLVRQLLVGNNEISMHGLLEYFQRVQLNFHAERTECNPRGLHRALREFGRGKQFIFQIDGAQGNRHLEALYGENDADGFVDAVPLFDISGGAGILPESWPKPIYMETDRAHVYHGYAGGLGPDNPRSADTADRRGCGRRTNLDRYGDQGPVRG